MVTHDTVNVRSAEWYKKNMPEKLPMDVNRVELETVPAAVFSTYLAVFAGRNGWTSYGVKFPTKEIDAPAKHLPLFWDAPILRKYLETGRIYEGVEQPDKSVSLYMEEADFIAYLENWADVILHPSNKKLKKSLEWQENYQEAREFAEKVPGIVEQWKENGTGSRYVRLESPFSLYKAAQLYDDLDNPNVISVGIIDGKKVRLTSETVIPHESRISTFSRSHIVEAGGSFDALVKEAAQEGIVIPPEIAEQLKQISTRELGQSRIALLGDIASIHSGSGESLPVYTLTESEILKATKNKAPDYLVYYTNKDSKTYDTEKFIRIINLGLASLFSRIRYLLHRNVDWKVPGVPDLRLCIAKLKK